MGNRNLKTIGAIILAVLLTLIFFSNTIYTYNLPVATAVSPKKGSLSKLEVTTGMVSFAEVQELYIGNVGGYISKLAVKEGDAVKAGQPIAYIDYNNADSELKREQNQQTDAINQKLSELNVSREKQAVEIEKININITNIQRKIQELSSEVYKPETVSDYELKQCESDIAKAIESFERSKTLYDSGVLARLELDNAEYTLKNLQDKYEELKKKYTEALEKSSDNISDKESLRQKQLKDYSYQLEVYKQDLETKRLELANLDLLEASYKKELININEKYSTKLSDYEKNSIIYAAQDSTVTMLFVNEGQYISANQHIASFGKQNAFEVICDISLENNFIAEGDICEISNSSHTIDGTVTKIIPEEHVKKVTVTIESEEVSSGETFEIWFEKESSETYTLVDNASLGMDSEGYFLLEIKRRNGILGKEFYTEKKRVYIGDSDSENTVIVKGVEFFEPIVLTSDKAFEDGDSIKIKNESDFFEE